MRIKKTIGLWLLLGTALTSHAQDTKQVTKNYQNPYYQEQYSVLKTDNNVKQGPYERRMGRSNTLVESGYYRNGVRDSIWTEYHWGGYGVRARGRYRHDQKAGVWEVFDTDGKLVQQYDYSNKQLLLNKPVKGAERITTRPLDAGVRFDAVPVYLGGYDVPFQFIAQRVQYPAEALRRQIAGEVRIAFTVGADGNVSNYHVAKGIGGGCDEESLRVIQLLPPTWVPARAGGQPVAAEVEIPIAFSIR